MTVKQSVVWNSEYILLIDTPTGTFHMKIWDEQNSSVKGSCCDL